jgi:hypothetical protein
MADQVARMGIPVIAVALAALGCVVHEVPRAPRYLDEAAKMSTPTPGQARLYVYRTGSILDENYFSISITASGKYLGQLGRDDYTMTDLNPGPYVLSATIRNVRRGVVYPSGPDVPLELARDHVYFVRVETRRLFPVYPAKVVIMDNAQGRQQLQGCKLVDGVYAPDR